VAAGVTAGVTAQLKFTVPLNELTAVTPIIKLAAFPALTVCDAGGTAVTAKSGGACTASDREKL
jgi:hypothetical protein